MVDIGDLKSPGRKAVRVRVPPAPPLSPPYEPHRPLDIYGMAISVKPAVSLSHACLFDPSDEIPRIEQSRREELKTVALLCKKNDMHPQKGLSRSPGCSTLHCIYCKGESYGKTCQNYTRGINCLQRSSRIRKRKSGSLLLWASILSP